MHRRGFLKACGLMAAGCAPASPPPLPPGVLSGPDHRLGHRLRMRDLPPPAATRRVGILIAGGGVGGLSAAWRLARAGYDDFLVCELEREPGGNSRAGGNAVSRYPLAAHYLPLPPPEAVGVRTLLGELGAILGDPYVERPRYDERRVCHAPQERLFRDGRWQEGLMPHSRGDAAERAEQKRFQAMVMAYRRRRDRSGRAAFPIPAAAASADPEFLELDRIGFREWLLRQGFSAPSLHWLADYACRDDFGTTAAETSAWAGLHYFASRSGEGENAIPESVLTAPEGNAWLVDGLASAAAGRIRSGCLVAAVRETRRGIEAVVLDPAAGRSERIVADRLIWGAPVFLLPKVVDGLPTAVAEACAGYDYAPWVVANLTLRGWPQDAGGAPPAWDNVIHAGPGLGYVVSTHQTLRVTDGPMVWTYYRALSDAAPGRWRQALLTIGRDQWAAAILAELSLPHPDLARQVERLDVGIHGHAMVRPLPGLRTGKGRALLAAGFGRFGIAHADAAGMSLFEEANERGIAAAEAALRALGRRVVPLRG